MNPDDVTVANGLLVSADWLEANLANPAIRIVDTRKCEGYAEAHIRAQARQFRTGEKLRRVMACLDQGRPARRAG